MSKTRMTLAVGLVAVVVALAFARGGEPAVASTPQPVDAAVLIRDDPATVSCHVGWKPVCVIRDGEQACACHPTRGVNGPMPKGTASSAPGSAGPAAKSSPERASPTAVPPRPPVEPPAPASPVASNRP